MTTVSATTKAVLMLVAPLAAGGHTEPHLPLTGPEYKRLAQALRLRDRGPGDLLAPGAAELLSSLAGQFHRPRLEELLGRGLQLALALELWQQRSIQVLSRADAAYPPRLKHVLGPRCPVLLYVCGNLELLQRGGLAVVGSRNASPALLAYTRQVGARAAAAGYTVVSGGARGVDQTSMQAAATAGGAVVGVLPHGLAQAVLQRDYRNALRAQQLLLCSPYDPEARFTAGQALGRNKVIYGLAEAALVVEAAVGRGGTWRGAQEQLQQFRTVPLTVPIYTRNRGPASAGLEALGALGAPPWPEPQDVKEFRTVMQARPVTGG